VRHRVRERTLRRERRAHTVLECRVGLHAGGNCVLRAVRVTRVAGAPAVSLRCGVLRRLNARQVAGWRYASG
jgi:hypothetical protein